jgi:hypothetical protein
VDRLDGYRLRVFRNKWDNNRWDSDDNDWDRDLESGVDYIMTKDNGLVRADGKKDVNKSDDDDDNDTPDKPEQPEKPEQRERQEAPDTSAAHDHKYRYHQQEPAKPKPASKPDTTIKASLVSRDAAQTDVDRIMSPGYRISCTL